MFLHKRSMAMVSENQSGDMTGTLQFLQFPAMIGSENNVTKRLKIKIPLNRVEAEPGTESCGPARPVIMNDDSGHSIPAKGKNKLVIKAHELATPRSGNTTLCADADNLKVKSYAMGSHKRKLTGVRDGQQEKRRKMDRGVTRQCSIILNQLMKNPAGWVFNHPVDPVKLKIPDYHSIISHPMDLGTIKTKLENSKYSSVEEFVADVRLTLSNAMVYNPPSCNVYHMAEQLNSIFTTKWNCFEARWNREHTNMEQGHVSSGIATDTNHSGQEKSPLHVRLLAETLISAEEKQKLRKQLLEVSREKMPPHLQGFLKKCGFNWHREGRFEVDIDAFDDETLRELKRVIRSSLGVNATKAGSAKKTENGCRKSLGKIVHSGTDSGHRIASRSANVNPMMNLVTPKCSSCGSMRCQCSLQSDHARASSSDLSSERSAGQNHVDVSSKNHEVKSLSTSQMCKSDLESDGAVSALDEELFCSSPQLSTVATTAASEEGWTPPIDIQLSPKKALRAAMLKSRFADTIFKAKHKTLLDHVDQANAVKLKEEKERLERQQREEAVRIEAQIKAAEAASRMRAEAELKIQREREREAARLAVLKIEKTVEIDDNLKILKDLEMLSGFSPSSNLLSSVEGAESVVVPLDGFHFGNPLERLGLFMKDEYIVDKDEDEDVILYRDGEDKTIFGNPDDLW